MKISSSALRLKAGVLQVVALASVLGLGSVRADGCEAGWFEFEDQCYFNGGAGLTKGVCEVFCREEKGAALPCVYNGESNAFLYNTFGKTWLGMKDAARKVRSRRGLKGQRRSVFEQIVKGGTKDSTEQGGTKDSAEDDKKDVWESDGLFTWTDKNCLSEYRNWHWSQPNHGMTEGCVVTGEWGRWHDYRCDDLDGGFNCICQKPHPTKIRPRGGCFSPGSPDFRTCFPWKCDGLYEDGDATCWDDAMVNTSPNQVAYEYMLSTEAKSLDEHEVEAQAWGGHVASIHSDAENDMMRSYNYGGKVYFSPKDPKTQNQCKDYCLQHDAQQPCIMDNAHNSFLTSTFGKMWIGFTDRVTEGSYKWTNIACNSNFRSWSPGQPDNDSGAQDCAYAGFRTATEWDDGVCDVELACVCEMEAPCPGDFLNGAERNDTSVYTWTDGTDFSYDKFKRVYEHHSDDSDEDLRDVNKTGVRMTQEFWQDVPASDRGCAPYKREKQLLQISIQEENNLTALLVPAVARIDISLEGSTLKHLHRMPGSYMVSGENKTDLHLSGTQTVIYMVRLFYKYQVAAAPYVSEFEFDFQPAGNGCLTKMSFMNVSQSLGEESSRLSYSDLHTNTHFRGDDLLIFQQFCGDSSSTSVFSGLTLRFGGCPEHSQLVIHNGTLKPSCRCNSGYRSKRFDSVEVKIDDECTLAAELRLEAGANWLSAEVANIDSTRYEYVSLFEVEFFKLFQATRSEVYPGHGNKIEKETPTLQAQGIQPGRWHLLHMVPTNASGVVELEDRAVIKNSILTHCSCSNENGVGDTTGTPLSFNITQEEGFVLFSFRDDSMCEDSYAFTREPGFGGSNDQKAEKAKESFAPNYYFHSRYACAQNPVSPGRQASDNLRVSRLKVGDNYTYCVRAAGQDYMQNPEGPEEPALASSNEICKTHRIQWEASIKGKVTMPRDAGSLPVKDVEVSWALLDTDLGTTFVSGSTVTSAGGKFEIVLNENILLDNYIDYPVHVKVSKKTASGNETINHTFDCNEGTIDCSENGTLVYVNHLQLDEPLHIVDSTTVLFTGKVVVGDTDDPDLSGDGCPIIGAEVCLIDKNAHGGEAGELCTKSNSFGEYELPAVIGMHVGVEIRYHEHEFRPLDDEKINLYQKGILIEAGMVYERNDFKDITTTDLFVDVAGGLCDKVLGTSSVRVSVSGGCGWYKDFTQEDFRGLHHVPAHIMDVRIVDVYDVNGDDEHVHLNNIRDYFLEDAQLETIDLRDLEKESEFEEQQANATVPRMAQPDITAGNSAVLEDEQEEQAEDEIEMRRVRFQFNGNLLLSMVVANDQVGGSCSVTDYLPSDYGCDSLHVLRAGVFASMTLFLKYELKDDLYCDITSPNLTTLVKNSLGPTQSEKDGGWPDYQALNQRVKDLLDDCSTDGCRPPVQHDETGSNARVHALLTTGPPNVLGEYIRWVDFDVDDTSHKACFVITGDFNKGDLDSFDLPSHEPLLVLRDPPGGMSYASYENVRTTMRVDSSSHVLYAGYGLGMSAGLSAEGKYTACAGGGFGVVFFACGDIVKAEVKGIGVLKQGTKFEKSFSEEKSAGTFTSTWSYKTSSDPYKAGSRSDVFLVPNINVKFNEIDTISWNATTCNATKLPSQQFDIHSPKNKPTFSFLSVESIRTSLIPKLERSVSLLKPDEQTKNQSLQEALGSWRNALADYEETNRKAAADGGLLSNVPSKWFDGKSNPHLQNALEDESQYIQPSEEEAWKAWAGLAPLDLVDQAELLDTGAGEQNEGGLEDAHRIKFSGGGGVMAFSLSYDMMKQHVEKLGKPRENRNVDFDGGTEGGLSLKSPAVGLEFSLDKHFNLDDTKSHHGSKSVESNTKISFVLGDDDIYGTDDFLVDIYTDPTYGTFVFHTTGGQSRCPHEEGTNSAAGPTVQVFEDPERPVLPDDAMIFKVRLGNTGVRSSRFELYIESQDNLGGLSASSGGGGLVAKRVFDLDAKEEIFTTVTVRRGPELFQYPPLTLHFRVLCGNDNNRTMAKADLYNVETEDNEKFIEFAQPCPQVHWSGDLRRDKGFVINSEKDLVDDGSLPVTVFNPMYSLNSFADLVNTTRLQGVHLQYREVGDNGWKDAFMLNAELELVDIDFASEGMEGTYGYITIPWAYSKSQISDGEYEIQVKTLCDGIDGAPDEFDGFSPNSITGIIDRIAPKQYGLPKPVDKLWPGEEVSIYFTEAIQCDHPYRFDLQVTVDGVDRTFDEDNLLVMCDRNKVSFAFDFGNVILDHLMGKEVHIELSRVRDLAGNKLLVAVEHTLEHAEADLGRLAVSFQMELDNNCSSFTDGGEDVATVVKEEVALSLDLSDTSRIEVVAVACIVKQDRLKATVTILPAEGGLGRRLEGNSGLHSQRLYRKLLESGTSEGAGDGQHLAKRVHGFQFLGLERPEEDIHIVPAAPPAGKEEQVTSEPDLKQLLLKMQTELRKQAEHSEARFEQSEEQSEARFEQSEARFQAFILLSVFAAALVFIVVSRWSQAMFIPTN